MLLEIITVSAAIWVMMFVWVKMTDKHKEEMCDVDPNRMKSGCASCSDEECTSKIEI